LPHATKYRFAVSSPPKKLCVLKCVSCWCSCFPFLLGEGGGSPIAFAPSALRVLDQRPGSCRSVVGRHTVALGDRGRCRAVRWLPDAAFGAAFAGTGRGSDWLFHSACPECTANRCTVMINPYNFVCQGWICTNSYS
jgi:hypothetical protein